MSITIALSSDAAKERAKRIVSEILPGDGLACVIRKEARTDEQNRRMWAMLRDVSRQVEWYGQKLKDEDWKHIFSASVEKQRAVPGLDGGFVVLGVSTRAQSKRWLGEMMDLIEAFGAERGVKFTAPDFYEGMR